MQILADYFGLNFDFNQEFLVMALILARTMPMVFLTPFLAGQLAPPEVKMAIGILFSILVWPVAREAVSVTLPHQALPFLALMLKEVFIGFTIGFVNSQLFYSMEIAGRMVDTVRGSAMGEVLSPHTRNKETPVGDIYYHLLLIFFVVLGGHHIFFSTFFFSFAAIPLHASIVLGTGMLPFVEFMVRISAQVLLIATLLAAPAIAATFITDIVFGILNRVAPQLNAYFMAMPVKAMAGIAMVLVGLAPFITRVEDFVALTLAAVDNSIRLLVGG